MHAHAFLYKLIETLVLSIQIVGSQVESIHIFLTTGQVLRWNIVGSMRFSC